MADEKMKYDRTHEAALKKSKDIQANKEKPRITNRRTRNNHNYTQTHIEVYEKRQSEKKKYMKEATKITET